MIDKTVNTKTEGLTVLHEITKSLREELSADFAFIGMANENFTEISTLSFCNEEGLMKNISYATEHTPCASVLSSEVCIYPADVQDDFPKDEDLVSMDIAGYLGYPLYNLNRSKVIGVFGALYRNEIDRPQTKVKKVQLLAPRVEMELDRHILTKTLESKEQLFDAITTQTTEGITVADMKGNYLWVNQAFCEMSGYSEEELLKLTVFDMKAKNQNHQSFYDSKEKYKGKAIRVNLQRKDGTEYMTEIIGDVIQVGGEQQVLGTIRDISDKLEIEKEVFRLNNELEKKVEERTEELNKTIESLNNEIELRGKVEQELVRSLEVKQMLLNEITHRVKNNLQIISSILNIQRSTVKNKEAEKICIETSDRIHSMALIHETLYKSEKFGEVHFKEYLNSLIRYLSDIYDTERIALHTDIDDVVLSIDAASCCGMIVLELMVNTIKYAFPKDREGDIQLVVKQKGDRSYLLKVVDNGVGMPSSFDPSESETLGMQLVFSLIEQIEGEYKISSEGGVCFEIEFKDKGRVL